MKLLSHVLLFVIPWTVAYQAPPSMEFSRQEYWSGLPFPSPGDLPNPGIEPRSPTLQADVLPSEPPGKPFRHTAATVAAKSLQSCPTLSDPMDCSLQGSSVHGIFQVRVLEWIAISFSRGSSRSRARTQVSCIAGRLYHLSHQGSPILHELLTNIYPATIIYACCSMC